MDDQRGVAMAWLHPKHIGDISNFNYYFCIDDECVDVLFGPENHQHDLQEMSQGLIIKQGKVWRNFWIS